jgi:hypothetical protein
MILIEVITVWILMKALDNRLCAVFSRTNAFDASISAVAGVTMAYLCADQLGMQMATNVARTGRAKGRRQNLRSGRVFRTPVRVTPIQQN